MGGRLFMRVRGSEALDRKAALLNPEAREEFRRVQRHNGCESMADWFIAKGWFSVGHGGEVVLYKRPILETREDAIEGIRLLAKLEKLGFRDIEYMLLVENGFRSAMRRFFNGKLYDTLDACFPEAGIQPWELRHTPVGLFDDPENRKRAFRWLAEVKLTKDPRPVSEDEVVDNGLSGLYRHSAIGGNLWRLKKEAYPEIKPWELPRWPAGVKLSEEELHEMVTTKAKDLGIDPRDLSRQHIPKEVLRDYDGHVINVLIAAHVIVTEEDRAYVETKSARGRARQRSLKAAQRQGSTVETEH